MSKQDFAKMQVQAELEKALASITSYGQYIDSRSEYGQQLEKLQKELSNKLALLAATE